MDSESGYSIINHLTSMLSTIRYMLRIMSERTITLETVKYQNKLSGGIALVAFGGDHPIQTINITY